MPIPNRPKKMDVAAAAEAVKQRSTSGVTVLFKAASAASRAGLLAAAVSELCIACSDSGVAMWILANRHYTAGGYDISDAIGVHSTHERDCRSRGAELLVSSNHRR